MYKVNTKIKNTTFRGNYAKDLTGKATYWGGGIESIYKDIEITDCVFDGNYVHNQSSSGGYAIAGAISVRNANKFYMANTRISGCYSRNSKASYRNYAGIIYLDDCNAKDGSMVSVIERCVFDSYNCPSSGSPASKSDILLNSGFLYMTNCLISAERGNHTHGNYSIRIEKCADAKTLRCTSNDGYEPISACYAELVNVTIADGQGTGVAALSDDADLILKNCIISGNATAGVINATTIEHSYIQKNVDDGTWNYEGMGNLNPDVVGDINWTGYPYYHLLTKRADGAITNGWFSGTFESPKCAADSPCIDAGAPGSIGLDLEPDPHGKRVNIGAYGGTPWASKTSPFPGFKLIIR